MIEEIINSGASIPDIEVDVSQTFDLDVDLKVPAFSEANEYVPSIDDAYRFDKNTTQLIKTIFSNYYFTN